MAYGRDAPSCDTLNIIKFDTLTEDAFYVNVSF